MPVEKYETWCYKKASNVGKIGEKAKLSKDRTLVARSSTLDAAVREGQVNTSTEIPLNHDKKPRAAAPAAAYGQFFAVVENKTGKIVATHKANGSIEEDDDEEDADLDGSLGGGLDDDDEG